MKRALSILFFTFFFPAVLSSQDTVRLMTYNILNYPYVAATRADTLAIIVDDVLPDIMIINELQNNSGATTILNNDLLFIKFYHFTFAKYINALPIIKIVIKLNKLIVAP